MKSLTLWCTSPLLEVLRVTCLWGFVTASSDYMSYYSSRQYLRLYLKWRLTSCSCPHFLIPFSIPSIFILYCLSKFWYLQNIDVQGPLEREDCWHELHQGTISLIFFLLDPSISSEARVEVPGLHVLWIILCVLLELFFLPVH